MIEPLTLTQNPNFSNNEKVGFSCEFNKPGMENYYFGLSTNAKEITGLSNIIDPNETKWNGAPSQLPFFQEEVCAIELTFENETDTLRDTLTINSSKTFDDGIWVENFEDGIPSEGIVYYNSSGGGMTFTVANDDPLLGNSYFKMGGRVNWDWALGSLDLPININNVSQSSNEIYVNIGILSDLVDLHQTIYQYLISEETDTPFNDNPNNNASDLFESTMEVYKMKVPVDWDGWQMKSFKYSDFEPLSPNDPNINFNMNPNDISAIELHVRHALLQEYKKIVQKILVRM